MWYLGPYTLMSNGIGEPPGEAGVDEDAVTLTRPLLKLVKVDHSHSAIWLKIELKVPCDIPFFIEGLPESSQLRDQQGPIKPL